MTTNTIRIVIDSSGAQAGANQAQQALGGISSAASRTQGALGGLGGAFAALGGVIAGLGLGALGKHIIDVNSKFQILQAQLTTATGSVEKAGVAFERLQAFAAKTPFTLDQAVEGFVKLKNLGLTPSERALTSYGNTSAAMGKSLMQMVEAVADASTGEFERLKEFGIKAKVEKDKVKLTFDNVTTTVANNAAAVEEYLLRLGETKFGGGMELQAKTLGGVMSTLGDTMDRLMVKFGEGGFAPAVFKSVEAMTAAAGGMDQMAVRAGEAAGQLVGGTLNAVVTLSENLDTLANVATLAGAAMVGRFVGPLVASAIPALATFAASARTAVLAGTALATISPAAAAATVSVSALSAATAGLAAAGRGLLALFGGPIGAALLAVGGAFYALHQRGEELNDTLRRTGAATDETRQYLENLDSQYPGVISHTAALGNEAATAAGKLAQQTAATKALTLAQIGQRRAQLRQEVTDLMDRTELGRQMRSQNPQSVGDAFRVGIDNFNATVGNAPSDEEIRRGIRDRLNSIRDLDKAAREVFAAPDSAFAERPEPRATGGLNGKPDADKDAKALARKREAYADFLKSAEQEAEFAGLVADLRDDAVQHAQAETLAREAGLTHDRARLQTALDLKRVNEGIRDAIEASNRAMTDMANETLRAASQPVDVQAIRQRYQTPEDNYRQQFAADRESLLKAYAQGQSSLDEMRRDLALIDKAAEDVATDFGRLMTNKVEGLADVFGTLFGQTMGDAFQRVANIMSSVRQGEYGGGVAGGLARFFTGGNPDSALGKSISESVGKAFDPKMFKDIGGSLKEGSSALKSLFKGGGSQAFTQVAGQAFAGAQQGEFVDGIFKALGVKSSKLGAQIGGALGSAIGGPIGGFIGSALGGIVGGLFKRTPSGSTVINQDGSTESGKLGSQLTGTANNVSSGLNRLAQALGADIGAFSVSIGKWGDYFRVSASGSSRAGDKRYPDRNRADVIYDGKDEAAATLAAIKNAIQDGALSGITDFSQRVLRAATDLDRAATLAAKYEDVVKQLAKFDDPVGAPIKELQKEFTRLAEQMRKNGATSEELANVERLRGLKQKQLMDQQLDSIAEFQRRLSGEGSGVTALSRLANARAEYDALRADIQAGKDVDQSRYTEVGQRVFDLSREIYGTATTQFQDIRSGLIADTGRLLDNVKSAFAAAGGNEPVVQAIDAQTQVAQDSNLLLQQILAAIRSGSPLDASGATMIGGAARYANGQVVYR